MDPVENEPTSELIGKTIAAIEPVAIDHYTNARREDPAALGGDYPDGWLITFTDGGKVYLRASYDDSAVHFEPPA